MEVGTSALIKKLREADQRLSHKNDTMIKSKLSDRLKLLRDFNADIPQAISLFQSLSKDLDFFMATNQMKASYAKSLETSRLVWSEISTENFGRLIEITRILVETIIAIMSKWSNFSGDSAQFFQIITNTRILDYNLGSDMYSADDIYSILIACELMLRLFRVRESKLI